MFSSQPKPSQTSCAGNVETLRAAGIQVCSLANNHVLDWSQEGLLETLDTLHQAGRRFACAGCSSRNEAVLLRKLC